MSRLLPDHDNHFSRHHYHRTQHHSVQGTETMNLRLVSALLLSSVIPAFAGQAPGAASSPDIAVSHRDRFYTSDQFSNTVSVIDPVDNKLLGVLRLGDPTPGNLSPLYKGQLDRKSTRLNSSHLGISYAVFC